jgi:hypothetical protein
MNQTLISKLAVSSLAVAGVFAGVGAASAATFTQEFSFTIPSQTTPFSQAFTLPGFNTSLGTLTGINLMDTVTTIANVNIVNTSSVNQPFTNATASVPLTLTGPGLGSGLVTTATATIPSGIVTPFPPANNFPGITNTTTGSADIPQSEWAAYTSGSPVSFTASGSLGTYAGVGSSSLFFGGSAEAGSVVKITYTYDVPDPTATPEPGALLGLGLIGGLGLLAKRKNS